VPACGHRAAEHVVVAGNMLAGEAVLDAILDTYLSSNAPFRQRLLAALDAGEAAGSDSRGLMSAAMLVVGQDIPPLTLRIDYSETPLADLRTLHDRATTGAYGDWMHLVPTLRTPDRAPTPADIARLSRPADPEDDTPAPIVES